MAVEKAGWEGGTIQSKEPSRSSIVEKQGAKAWTKTVSLSSLKVEPWPAYVFSLSVQNSAWIKAGGQWRFKWMLEEYIVRVGRSIRGEISRALLIGSDK